jgi:hypothetical protein
MNALNLAAAAAVEAAWHDIACRSPAGQRSTSPPFLFFFCAWLCMVVWNTGIGGMFDFSKPFF